MQRISMRSANDSSVRRFVGRVVNIVVLVGIGASALAQAGALPVVTVGPTEQFHDLQQAIDQAPETGEVIRLAPGKYREKIHVNKANIHLIGTGAQPKDVVLSWDDAAVNAGGTSKSGSVSVNADGFEAENLTIENTWEDEHTRLPEGSQAVALLMSSDRAVLDHVRLLGAQDTLYANSRTCHDNLPRDGSAPPLNTPPCQASRQYFRDCYIEGHVDFIFGDAKAVFDHCELHPRHNATVMLTAQSKHFPAEDSGYYFLHCSITGEDNGDKVIFGRPWRDYSTVTFYDTEVNKKLDPDGWSDWAGRLKTSTYREYKSHGPGVNGGRRIVTYPKLTHADERQLNARTLLAGSDGWNPEKAADELRKLR